MGRMPGGFDEYSPNVFRVAHESFLYERLAGQTSEETLVTLVWSKIVFPLQCVTEDACESTFVPRGVDAETIDLIVVVEK
jgi:hypothetical protein